MREADNDKRYLRYRTFAIWKLHKLRGWLHIGALSEHDKGVLSRAVAGFEEVENSRKS